MSKQKEDRFSGSGLCHQCGRKQPFSLFICKRCDLINTLLHQVIDEMHLMNRRQERNLQRSEGVSWFLQSNLVDALIEGKTKWNWREVE